jgi:thiol-disulfide isomerase/thioredoxin
MNMNKAIRFTPSSLTNTGGAGDGMIGRMQNMASGISYTYVAIALVIVIIIVIMYYMFKSQLSSMFDTAYKPNSEHIIKDGMNSSSGQDVELLFFSTDWCPHCKTAKPEWEQLVSEYDGKTINGRKVIFTDVNCTNESPDVDRMMDQYHIEGFPTIKLLKDGQVISYDAKPTKATLIQFLNTAV